MRTVCKFFPILLLSVTCGRVKGPEEEITTCIHPPPIVAICHTGSQLEEDALRSFEMFVRLNVEGERGYVRCGKAPLSAGDYDEVEVSWTFDGTKGYLLQSTEGQGLTFVIEADSFGSGPSGMTWNSSTGSIWDEYAEAYGWQTSMAVKTIFVYPDMPADSP